MKKVWLVVVATMAVLPLVTAQTVKYGAKAGVNFATLNGDTADEADLNMRTSFHVGGVAEIMFNDQFSFQPELLYSSQGAQFEDAALDLEAKLKLDYLTLPLMGKYYPIEGLSLQLGPQVGYLVSAKSEVEIGGVSDEEDVKDDFKSIEFGVNVGAGYKLSSGLFFDARYNLGLSTINDDNADDFNAVIQLSVGFLF